LSSAWSRDYIRSILEDDSVFVLGKRLGERGSTYSAKPVKGD